MNQVLCEHCGYDTEIRNPSGFCDHLYYPESCKVCDERSNEDPKLILRQLRKILQVPENESIIRHAHDIIEKAWKYDDLSN